MAQASFIPYNLRAAYGLPTPEHHEGFTPTISTASIQRAKTVRYALARTPTTIDGRTEPLYLPVDYESGFHVRRSRWGWMSTWPNRSDRGA